MCSKVFLVFALVLMFASSSFTEADHAPTTLTKLVLPPANEMALYKKQLQQFQTIIDNNQKKMALQQGPVMLGIKTAYRVIENHSYPTIRQTDGGTITSDC